MFEQERWERAWRCLGAVPREGLLADMIARYSEPHRFYHTLRHLEECFAAFAPATHLALRPAEVEVALWFHDAIYDTRAQDNEDRSARWAEQALLAGGAGSEMAARVRNLVLATKHNVVPQDEEAKLLVDVDLSILGAPEARFVEYERQIRQEYAWVPEADFRQARMRILESFLERPCLYSTAWFAGRLEERARKNLRRSLRELVV